MLVYPPDPINEKFDIKIRGRVALLAGDRLRVPNIVPQRFDRVERFVVLPLRLDLQGISWETVGLSRAELPAQFAEIRGDVAANSVYRVDGDQFQASLRGVQRAASTARVRLADIHLAWQPDGLCQGVASFDIEPAGATRCKLELPTAHQLVHASIEGLPALLVKTGDNVWQVNLGPAQLPQRLDVVFRGPYSGAGEHKRFEAPRLPELEVDETLWTIYSPDQFTVESAALPVKAITSSEQELCRLRAIAALSQLPAEIVGEHLPDEIVRWYQPWRRRYAASRAGLMEDLASGRQDLEQSAEEIEARQLDAQISAVDARLAARTPSPRSISVIRSPAELLQVGQTSSKAIRYVVEREAQSLDLHYAFPTAPGWAGRILVATVVVVVAAGALFLLRGRTLPKFAPGLVTVTTGTVWWLALSPSIAGLAIVVLGIWMTLREQGPPARCAISQ